MAIASNTVNWNPCLHDAFHPLTYVAACLTCAYSHVYWMSRSVCRLKPLGLFNPVWLSYSLALVRISWVDCRGVRRRVSVFERPITARYVNPKQGHT